MSEDGGSPRPAPGWLTAVMLVTSALLVPLLVAADGEDAALNGRTTGAQQAAGGVP